PGHALEIGRMDRLLDELEVAAGVLQSADRRDRVASRPALVRVEAESRAGADRLADPPDPLEVCGRVAGADLHLQYVEAFGDPIAAGSNQRFRIARGQRHVG